MRRGRSLVADAVQRGHQAIERGRHDREVGDGLRHRSPVDPIAHGVALDAGADLAGDAGEVAPESRGQRDAEPGCSLGSGGDAPVHRVQARGRHADTDLPLAGVRLGDVPDFRDFGATELFVDDGATHVDLQFCLLMGTWAGARLAVQGRGPLGGT